MNVASTSSPGFNWLLLNERSDIITCALKSGSLVVSPLPVPSSSSSSSPSPLLLPFPFPPPEQELHGPPQSTWVSPWFFMPSEQLGLHWDGSSVKHCPVVPIKYFELEGLVKKLKLP